MNIQLIIEHWIRSSEEDYKTAEVLYSRERYVHTLFFCHLTIEKILKALVVQNTGTHAPYDHNLMRLAELTKLELTQKQIDDLIEINSFNIKSRYDDYKFEFYKKATKEYAEKYFINVSKIYLWFKQQLLS